MRKSEEKASRPVLVVFFAHQICQAISLLLLNLNMRNNCEWTYFKSIKPLNETHCMLYAPKTLHTFYFHIHACGTTPLFSQSGIK